VNALISMTKVCSVRHPENSASFEETGKGKQYEQNGYERTVKVPKPSKPWRPLRVVGRGQLRRPSILTGHTLSPPLQGLPPGSPWSQVERHFSSL